MNTRREALRPAIDCGVTRHLLFLPAMNRSHSLASALVLVATFFALTPMSGAATAPIAPLPDARILSAVPFQFEADAAIISPAPETPSDSRIFKYPRDAHISSISGERVFI